jgi:hypothetical protein
MGDETGSPVVDRSPNVPRNLFREEQASLPQLPCYLTHFTGLFEPCLDIHMVNEEMDDYGAGEDDDSVEDAAEPLLIR